MLEETNMALGEYGISALKTFCALVNRKGRRLCLSVRRWNGVLCRRFLILNNPWIIWCDSCRNTIGLDRRRSKDSKESDGLRENQINFDFDPMACGVLAK